MTDPRPGSQLSAFAAKGVRAVFSPAVRSHAAVALVVAAAAGFLAHSGPTATAIPHPAAAQATPVAAPAGRISYDLAREHQGAFRKTVAEEAGKYATPALAGTMLGYVRLVQANRNPLDRGTDAMYGLDDGQWAWMMRGFADKVGLSDAMNGVHVNRDGTVDAVSAQALQNMLDLKNDVGAATKVFAAWLSSEISAFDGQSGRAPTHAETAMIAVTGDEAAARQASYLAEDEPNAKLGPEVQVGRGSWKRALFVDRKGWMGARDAVASVDRAMTDAIAHAQDPLPSREEIKLEEDLTPADFRAEPGRLASIVARTVAEMSPGSVYGLHAGHAMEVSEERVAPIMASKLMTLATSIDKLRGQDLSGGVYAIGPGQWITTIEETGDSELQASWAAGVEMHEDGSVHAKSAESFGSLMRLRDDARIATQVVATRMALQMDTLKASFGRIPHDGMLLTSHLYGVAAAEDFGRAIIDGRSIRAPRFSEGDPRNSWGVSGEARGLATKAADLDASVPARQLEASLMTLSQTSENAAKDLLVRHYEARSRHADVVPTPPASSDPVSSPTPTGQPGDVVDGGVDQGPEQSPGQFTAPPEDDPHTSGPGPGFRL